MDPDNPQPNASQESQVVTPTITPEQTAEIESKAQAKAEAIATEKIEKMKEDLAASLAGKKPDTAPKSWDELYAKQEQTATQVAQKAVKEALEADRKSREDKEQLTVKQQEDQTKAEWARMSTEWSEAVNDGIIPDISSEVKAKLKSGVQFSALSTEEQNDPGLKAYNDARALHIKLHQEGKSNSFYRTIDKFYNKQPAGAGAPVIGGAVPTPTSSDLSYEDIQANRRDKYGF